MADPLDVPDPVEPLDRLDSLLLDAADVGEFLGQLARLATRVVGGSVSCGITVRYDGNPLTVGSSDDRAERLDESQYRFDNGPCLEALATGQVVAIDDLDDETRWGHYLELARQEGLRCSLSLPLTLAGTTFGAMNLYCFERPRLFTGDVRRQLEIFAAQAAGMLRLATRQVADRRLREQMDEALASRTVIDQAIGIVMGQRRIPSGEAFGLLRRESQNSRRRLREVAADLVARTGGQEPEPGRPFHTD